MTTPRAPHVSIVIALYNGGRFIGRTLDGVVRQTFGDFEVIVVDDGSIDDGPALVASRTDPRIRLTTGPHAGIAATRNRGHAEAARSTFLIFLDQDDVWRPDFLERATAALRQRPDATAAFALADFVDADDVWAPATFSAYMRDRPGIDAGRVVLSATHADVDLTQVFIKNPIYPPSCLLIRRSAFETLGGFDGRFQVADDWDMVARLARCGPILPIDEVLVGYRRHEHNASLNTPRNVRETRLLWATVRYSAANSALDARNLDTMWRWHQRRTSVRKRGEALVLLRAGHPFIAMRRLADAATHAVLLRPLRGWLRHRRAS